MGQNKMEMISGEQLRAFKAAAKAAHEDTSGKQLKASEAAKAVKPHHFGRAIFVVGEPLMVRGGHFVISEITKDGITLRGVGKTQRKQRRKRQ